MIKNSSAIKKIVYLLRAYTHDIEPNDYSWLQQHYNEFADRIELASDINSTDRFGHTVLVYAVMDHDISIVKMLINAGVDLTVRKDNQTMLILAVIGGNEEIIRLLLAAGADVNAYEKVIGKKCHEECYNHEGWSALMFAGDITIAKMLIEAGADVNHKNEDGDSVFFTQLHNEEIVRLLIDYGAQVDERDAYGLTPLMRVLNLNQDSTMAKMLIDVGADVNACVSDGVTVLMYAASHANRDGIQMLIDSGADVNARSHNGLTALMYASGNSVDVVKILINAGADLNVASHKSGDTALTFAVFNGNVEVVKVLVDAGADINHKNNNGNSALMIAQEEPEDLDMVKIFIGADAKDS